jgi:GTP-binding nuclear protein Ran
MTSSTKYKVSIVGDAGVGKTTWLKRHRTGKFTTNYIATMGVEVHPLSFYSNKGQVILNTWDCAGQEKLRGEKEGYWTGSDAIIVMFDVTSKTSFKSVCKWIKDVRKAVPIAQIIVVKPQNVPVSKWDEEGIEYCELSSYSNYNFEKPLLSICRRIKGDDFKFDKVDDESSSQVSERSSQLTLQKFHCRDQLPKQEEIQLHQKVDFNNEYKLDNETLQKCMELVNSKE